MTIFHNSNVPDTDTLVSPSPPSSPPNSPSYVASRTKSVMRFALQSRMYEEPASKTRSHLPQQTHEDMDVDDSVGTQSNTNGFSTSFTSSNDEMNLYGKHWENLCDDPTVEESIECVFGHQLEDGLEIGINVEDYLEDEESSFCAANGSIIGPGSSSGIESIHSHVPMKRYASGKLVQVGSFSPFPHKNQEARSNTTERDEEDSVDSLHEEDHNNANAASYRSKDFRNDSNCLIHGMSSKSATTLTSLRSNTACEGCANRNKCGTDISPYDWPQYPLLLKPTPGSGTRIRGVRYANSTDYIMDGTCKNKWWDEVCKTRNDDDAKRSSNSSSFCDKCCPCPINNGNEEPGRTLVIDFESDLFQGTMQLRIRHTNSTTSESYDDSYGYFSGLNRQYQSVVQGRFLKDGIPMKQCLVGQTFSQPIKPPSPYVAKGAFKVMRFFAPRLITSIDSDKPHVLSPLGSTPQTINVDVYDDTDSNGDFKAGVSITENLTEPAEDSRRLVPCKYAKSSENRAKARKKVFDKVCSDDDDSITFRTDRIYTFEFLQHLINFEKLEVGLGNILGKLKLSPILNGQPMNLQAARQLTYGKNPTFEPLWSFDLWHESIIISHDMGRNTS